MDSWRLGVEENRCEGTFQAVAKRSDETRRGDARKSLDECWKDLHHFHRHGVFTKDEDERDDAR